MMQDVARALEALYETERRRIARLGMGKTGDYANPVFGEGTTDARLMLIGEAPGRDEAAAGKPFVGKAGVQLNELLALAGIPREEVFVTNVVKFRPTTLKLRTASNRTPGRAEISAGLPVLNAELRLIAPRMVATLGNTPLTALAMLNKLAPTVIGECHGQAHNTEDGFILFPLYHPASAIYNPSLLDVMKNDIIQLGKLYAAERGDLI